MTRRLLLLLIPLAATLAADSERDAADLIVSAATGLSSARPEMFLDAFDSSTPDLEKLRYGVNSLTAQANLTCSIEILSNEGDDSVRTLTLDWILRIDPKGSSPTSARRQKTVKVGLKKFGKKWRIVSFDPVDLFAPVQD